MSVIYCRLLVMYLSLWAISAGAYDNVVTHRLLTKESFLGSVISTNRKYLIDIIGDDYAIKEAVSVNGKIASEWFEDGADFEDVLSKDKLPGGDKACRAANHFHHPIKGWQDGVILPWDQAQMTDGSKSEIGKLVNKFCVDKGWSLSERKSSVTWGTAFLEPVAEGAQKAEMPRQQWSWDDARLHFYRALTETDKEIRDQELADTFRGVGHVVHLIQDSAQPAHVRNDFQSHLTFTHFNFKEWDKSFGSLYEYYVKKREYLVFQAQPVMPEIENPSLTDFWDTNTYDGTVQLGGLDLGLTELTNANYFSDETIPNNVLAWKGVGFEEQARQHLFPFPKLSDEDYEVCLQDVLMDAGDATEIYIARKSKGGCSASGDKFASRYADSSFINSPGMRDISKMELSLNGKVYETYARELLPLAIGYSTALINYFFRGRLGAMRMPRGVMIKNINEEAMEAYIDEQGNTVGEIDIYYDREDGSRKLLARHILSAALAPGETTPLIEFDYPSDNVTPRRFIAVFRGKLGKEEGAVIGRVVSPKIYYVSEQEEGGQIVRKIMRMLPDGKDKTVVFDNLDPNFIVGKFSVSSDGSRIVFSGQALDSPGYLYLLDISEPDAVPELLIQGVLPDWSPVENKLVFQRGNLDQNTGTGGQIFVYDLDARTEQQLISGVDWSGIQPAWSPDGQRIAYLTNEPAVLPPDPPGPGEIGCGNAQQSVEIMDLNGVHVRSATECLNDFYLRTDTGQLYGYPSKVSRIQAPAWSPDGAQVLYTGNYEFLLRDEPAVDGVDEYMDYRYQLYTINVDTQTEAALFDQEDEKNVQFTGFSSWSLGGQKIAVTRYGITENQKLTLATANIVLLDAQSGDKISNLTAENSHGDFYPDFAY